MRELFSFGKVAAAAMGGVMLLAPAAVSAQGAPSSSHDVAGALLEIWGRMTHGEQFVVTAIALLGALGAAVWLFTPESAPMEVEAEAPDVGTPSVELRVRRRLIGAIRLRLARSAEEERRAPRSATIVKFTLDSLFRQRADKLDAISQEPVAVIDLLRASPHPAHAFEGQIPQADPPQSRTSQNPAPQNSAVSVSATPDRARPGEIAVYLDAPPLAWSTAALCAAPKSGSAAPQADGAENVIVFNLAESPRETPAADVKAPKAPPKIEENPSTKEILMRVRAASLMAREKRENGGESPE